jgi:hypothetical protein
MWNKIRFWLHENDRQLTWFFIGLFVMCFFVDMGKQNYPGAVLDAFIVGINYILRPR